MAQLYIKLGRKRFQAKMLDKLYVRETTFYLTAHTEAESMNEVAQDGSCIFPETPFLRQRTSGVTGDTHKPKIALNGGKNSMLLDA